MPRGEQIQRHWNMLRTLQTRGEGIPLAQLAQEFEVSERTIQRDFELLQELGFPIEYDEDEYGKRFWRMPHDFFKTGSLTLSLTEAISLHLAKRLFTPLAGTHYVEGFQAILNKIRSLIPQKALDHFSGLNDIFHVRPFASTDYSRYADIVKMLDNAIQKSQTVEVKYRSLWRADEYITHYDPYALVLHLDDLYLVGKSHRANAIRIFKVNRILDTSPTEQNFGRPEEFDIEDFFRSSFGISQTDREPIEIEVQFKGIAAAVVEERIWHDSQKLEWLPNEANLFDHQQRETDTLIARFKLAEVIEFIRWLKGFGDQAVVLQPEWLRDEMCQELKSAAAQYER